jgi:hypothetical protein
MTRRASTRNPVRVLAVQFSSRLVGRNGCGQGRRDSGRLRPAPVFGLRPATAQLGPEKSAGCGSGSVFQIECHALLYTCIQGKEDTKTKDTEITRRVKPPVLDVGLGEWIRIVRTEHDVSPDDAAFSVDTITHDYTTYSVHSSPG